MKNPYCTGCFPVYQENQLAHCDYGGCLWCPTENDFVEYPVEDSYKNEIVIKSKENENNMKVDEIDPVECSICYEVIDADKNNCTTECGHKFCLKCLANAMYNDTWNCPYCRKNIIDVVEYDSDETDQDEILLINFVNNQMGNQNPPENPVENIGDREYDADDEYYSDDQEDDPVEEIEEQECPRQYCSDIDILTEKILNAGFSTKDLVYILLERECKQYTEQDTIEMLNRFDNLIYEIDNENHENYLFRQEDLRDIDSIS